MVTVEDVLDSIAEDGTMSDTEASCYFLCSKITQGMHILNSMDFNDPKDDILIFMDDLECADPFLSRPNLTMSDTLNYFDTSKPSYALVNNQESNGKKVIPFSKIMKEKIGQCLEMSILSQLSFQRNNESSFLCGGRTNQDSANLTHAWNLVKRDNQYFVFDCGLGFYAPLKSLNMLGHELTLHPDYEKSVGNKEKIIYTIGNDW